jgi:hypothetical protein
MASGTHTSTHEPAVIGAKDLATLTSLSRRTILRLTSAVKIPGQ